MGKKAEEGKKAVATETTVRLKPINRQSIEVVIEGITSLIQHKWSEKAIREIREKKGGKKTKNREICDPESEFKAATYFTRGGKYAIPVSAIKNAIITAAHKDIGIEKTLVKKALFIRADEDGLILMKCDRPIMREDYVRVGMGGADLRYRPEFKKWEVTLHCDIDAELLQPADLINLINRAGFGVGIGEWRPEKSGDNGRFQVKG